MLCWTAHGKRRVKASLREKAEMLLNLGGQDENKNNPNKDSRVKTRRILSKVYTRKWRRRKAWSKTVRPGRVVQSAGGLSLVDGGLFWMRRLSTEAVTSAKRELGTEQILGWKQSLSISPFPNTKPSKAPFSSSLGAKIEPDLFRRLSDCFSMSNNQEHFE